MLRVLYGLSGAVRASLVWRQQVDNVHKALFSMQGEVNIKISMETGIAGLVAREVSTLNIQDAYDHPQFNKSFDKKSGYRTKAILCLPIKAISLSLSHTHTQSPTHTNTYDPLNIWLTLGPNRTMAW